MKEIKLTRGMVAIVDDEDFDRLSVYSWYAHAGEAGNYYAARRDGNRKMVWMQKEIMRAGDHEEVDHIDLDGLNNTRRHTGNDTEDMMSATTCKNCGGDDAIHHYLTNQCPVGGREAPVGRKQEWKSTTYEPVNDELASLRATVAALTASRADLMAQLAACGNAEPPNVDSAAAYRRGWCDAREAAAGCASGVWRLKDELNEYNMINLQCVSDTIADIEPPTEHDADML